MLNYPYLSIENNRLIIYTIFGLYTKIYRFQSLEQLSILNNGMFVLKVKFVKEEDKVEIIHIKKLGINRKNFRALIQLISSN